jgi:hypothetical protein
MSFDTYKSRIRDEPTHPLVGSVFFCHRGFFVLDLMHLVDCRGIAALTYGGALLHLLADPRAGRNREERLRVINDERQAHYKNRANVGALPKILIASVARDGWGDLTGRAYKAAVTRNASPFFRELVVKWCTSETRVDVCLRSVVSRLDDVYQLLYSQGLFLDDVSQVALRAHCIEYGESYQELRQLSRRAHLHAFPVRPKCHKFQHIPYLSSGINPKATQAYGEESLVGTVVGTWQGSVAGTYASSVQEVVLVKRAVALLMRFELALF